MFGIIDISTHSKMMNKNKQNKVRNNVAWGMITSGTGRSQVFRDKRDRRSKDARRKREQFE
jgi:hypothetical protein